MSKYKKNLIYKYYNGFDIEPYDIDELESDAEFIIEVTKVYKDKNMYSLCDDKLKSNKELVKTFIETFKDDHNFVINVANNYFNLIDDEKDYYELNIFITKLYGKRIYDEIDLLPFAIKASTIYSALKVDISAYKLRNPRKDDDIIMMGFIVAKELYASSPIILDYIAERMLHEIIDNEEMPLEDIIHKTYSTTKEFENKCDFATFLEVIIANYDATLSSYIISCPELLEYSKKEYNKIKCNYQNYIDNKMLDKADLLDDIIKEFADKYFVCYSEVMAAIISDNDLPTSYLSYTSAYSCYIDSLGDETEDDKMYMEVTIKRIKEKFDYKSLKRNLKKAIESKEVDPYIIEMEKNKTNKKVVEFKQLKKIK